MIDVNPTTLDLVMRHKKAVEALLAFSSIYPSDDEFHSLVELLSSNLDDSFKGVYPHLCGLYSSNSKSGVPSQGSDLVFDDSSDR